MNFHFIFIEYRKMNISSGKEDEELSHYVLVVGYGRMHGVDYWLVKNSFSNLWGSEGYVSIFRDI